MDFFDKLGKKATEAYKVTADKTGKLAKETKLKFKMGELKSKIEDIYEEIGKKVYEKHVQKEDISANDLLEECKKIDDLSNEIEKIRQECLDLKDKKVCQKCFKEIDKTMKFCPECGAKQETENVQKVEVIEKPQVQEQTSDSENTPQVQKQTSGSENTQVQEQTSGAENTENERMDEEAQTNLEKTTEVEINPDAQNITEEELKNIGQ